jgi:hypothetical protein
MVLVALAGPGMNFLLAVIGGADPVRDHHLVRRGARRRGLCSSPPMR